MHWVIEAGVFPATAPRLIAAIEARRDRWSRYEDGIDETALPPPGAPVVFWGSLGAAYRERVAARWHPGAIGELDAFRVATYAPRLGALLVNAETVATTVRAFVEQPAPVLAALRGPRRVFVRPDGADKPFSGRVLDAGAIDRAALDHGFYYDDDELPIVVAPARSITREWRTVVAAGHVVTGCAYAADRRGIEPGLPPSVHALAARVAALAWQPAPIYIVDLAEADGRLGVVELNPFSGADLYTCDAAAIVDAVAEIYG